MRVIVLFSLLAATSLAGCADLGSPEVPFEQTCPSWIPGRNTMDVTQAFSDKFNTTEREDELASGNLQFLDYPLDRVEMNFHWTERDGQTIPRGVEAVNSTITASFFGQDGRHLKAWEMGKGPSTAAHTMLFDGYHTNFTLMVNLVEPNAQTEPQPVIVRWTWDEDNNPVTKSGAVARYQGIPWYRQC